MNWSDYAVLAVIIVFALIGLAKGFVMTVFKIVSFFACIYASIKFSPVLAGFLEKTPIYEGVRKPIMKTLQLQGQEVSANASQAVSGSAGADAVIKHLTLPEFMKNSMMEKLPSPSSLIDIQGITNVIGDELTKMVISVISLVAMYIILRIVMAFIGIILKGVSKLPVFKQVDKLGGFALGAMEGFLAIFIICAILMLFNANQNFASIFTSLDSSMFANWFYENNFIISWLFPSAAA